MKSWRRTEVAPARTHHQHDGRALYRQRFDEVLSFHAPGLAAVRRGEQGWHIDIAGKPAYDFRFTRTFGFYEGRAAVVSPEGWHHVLPSGRALSAQRYAWCGNYQGGRCAVRQLDGQYLHLGRGGVGAYSARWSYAGDFRERAAVVRSGKGESTHIDEQGRFVHGRWFEDLGVFHKGLATARDARGWTHVDREGRPLYRQRFASAEPFYNGQSRVERLDGQWAIIRENGEVVVEITSVTRV